MRYHVRMDVHPPRDLPAAELDKLKAAEKARAEALQRDGTWRHLWRIAGAYATVSVFDVADHDELHAILSTLPLFPFMTIEVTPLARHPSAIGAQGPRQDVVITPVRRSRDLAGRPGTPPP